MKKRKVDLESKGSQNIYSDEIITISKEYLSYWADYLFKSSLNSFINLSLIKFKFEIINY